MAASALGIIDIEPITIWGKCRVHPISGFESLGSLFPSSRLFLHDKDLGQVSFEQVPIVTLG